MTEPIEKKNEAMIVKTMPANFRHILELDFFSFLSEVISSSEVTVSRLSLSKFFTVISVPLIVVEDFTVILQFYSATKPIVNEGKNALGFSPQCKLRQMKYVQIDCLFIPKTIRL